MNAAVRISTRPAGRGFTLVEALVSVALLVAVMAAVSQVFSLSAATSSRTVAQSETIDAAAAFEHAVRQKLALLRPGSVLIIDCPPAVNQSDIPGGDRVPLRQDRLVFVAAGAPTQFESVTDRNLPSLNNPINGVNAGLPVGSGMAYTSAEALVYFGPGLPDGQALANAPGQDWILANRNVLLGVPVPPGGGFASFTGETPALEYPLDGLAIAPPLGLYACGIDAVTETSNVLLNGPNRVLARLFAQPNGTTVPGLFAPNLCPAQVDAVRPTAPTDNLNYFRRAGFNLQSRIADLRIEWTDGSFVDPRDLWNDQGAGAPDGLPDNPGTQWYGAPRDSGESRLYAAAARRGWSAPSIAPWPSGDVCEKWRWLEFFDPGATLPESNVAAFGRALNAGRIESDAAVAGQNAYRAIWTPATWAFRPRALRFTFRAYDAQSRLSAAEPTDTTVPADGANDATVRRFGLEYSFVVQLPS